MPKVNRHTNNGSDNHKEPDFRLAVLLSDLDRVDPIALARLTRDRLDVANPIRLNVSSTDALIAFTGKLIDAAIVADLLRNEDRKGGDSATTIYLQNGNGDWKKTKDNAVFTVTVKGKIHLNPGLFCVTLEQEAPPRQRLTFGD